MSLDMELDVRDAALMADLADAFTFQAAEEAREQTKTGGLKIPSGYVLMPEQTLSRIEFAITQTADLCRGLREHYEADANTARIAEVNEWTAAEFRRGDRTAEEIVAEAAQRLKALS